MVVSRLSRCLFVENANGWLKFCVEWSDSVVWMKVSNGKKYHVPLIGEGLLRITAASDLT